MHIRCEKCNTLYELDETLLPSSGAPVQCSKCQFVFKAFPSPGPEPGQASAEVGGAMVPGASGAAQDVAREGEGAVLSAAERGVVQEAAANASGRAAASLAEPESTGAKGQAKKTNSSSSSAAAAPDEPQFTADGRPIRKVPFPTMEEPAAPTGPRPVLGRVPSRPSSSAQRRWARVLVPVALALLLAAIIAWLVLGRHSSPPSAPQPTEGHSLLLRHGWDSPAWPRVTSSVTPGSAHQA